jgi:hypothetical protein
VFHISREEKEYKIHLAQLLSEAPLPPGGPLAQQASIWSRCQPVWCVVGRRRTIRESEYTLPNANAYYYVHSLGYYARPTHAGLSSRFRRKAGLARREETGHGTVTQKKGKRNERVCRRVGLYRCK